MSTTTQEERIETLERQVEALCNLLGLTPEAVAGGDIEDVKLECESLSLSATKYLTLRGNSIELRTDKELTLKSGTSMEAKAGSTLNVQSSADMNLNGNANTKLKGATVTVEGGGTTSIKGSLVQLNKGGLPVARMSDPVTVPGSSPGTIANGSTTVLA